jgi:hypothetical protein
MDRIRSGIQRAWYSHDNVGGSFGDISVYDIREMGSDMKHSLIVVLIEVFDLDMKQEEEVEFGLSILAPLRSGTQFGVEKVVVQSSVSLPNKK